MGKTQKKTTVFLIEGGFGGSPVDLNGCGAGKTPFLSHLHIAIKNAQFTKTGSGQTYGKETLKKRRLRLRFARRPREIGRIPARKQH